MALQRVRSLQVFNAPGLLLGYGTEEGFKVFTIESDQLAGALLQPRPILFTPAGKLNPGNDRFPRGFFPG